MHAYLFFSAALILPPQESPVAVDDAYTTAQVGLRIKAAEAVKLVLGP